jgi:hypothetical protein
MHTNTTRRERGQEGYRLLSRLLWSEQNENRDPCRLPTTLVLICTCSGDSINVTSSLIASALVSFPQIKHHGYSEYAFSSRATR